MEAAPLTEDNPLSPNEVCIALTDFEGQQEGDLPFRRGEQIIIIKPSEVLFWYKAKNTQGQIGLVPRTFLEPITDYNNEAAGGYPVWQSENSASDYLPMNPANPATGQPMPRPCAHAQSNEALQPIDPIHLEVLRIQEKERRRRLPPCTLVIGTCQFVGEEDGDLPFAVYEEMSILYPMRDLCWYYAQKTDHPEEKGVIPITHVRLVYMSDDEDDEEIYKAPPKPAHDRLYDDINDFVSQSGWFSYPGLAHGKTALQHVLAKKAKLTHEKLLSIQHATYLFNYRRNEKIFLGAAKSLSDDLCKHFECFGKKRDEIREIDDELCHHTDSSEWEVTVWQLNTEDIEVECAKKIIELEALTSSETPKGLTEELRFTSMDRFDRLWEWFSPN